MELRASDTITVRRKCTRCDGEGRYATLWCTRCQRLFGSGAKFTAMRLPCGHSTIHLKSEERSCSACRGEGHTEYTITVGDLVQYASTALATEIEDLIPEAT